MGYIAMEQLDDTQRMTVRILREFGTGKIYLHNDRQEGLVSAKAVEILEAMGIVEVLGVDRLDPMKRMQCRIRETVEPVGEIIPVRFVNDRCMWDMTSHARPMIERGTHNMIRVKNPEAPTGHWLVLEDRPTVGQAEDSLRMFPQHVVFIDDLADSARRVGLRLADFAEGEDVTLFKIALQHVTESPVTIDDAMAVIELLAQSQPVGVHVE